jgi:hypothetical protein
MKILLGIDSSAASEVVLDEVAIRPWPPGTTGTGKTRMVEATAESLVGEARAVIRRLRGIPAQP